MHVCNPFTFAYFLTSTFGGSRRVGEHPLLYLARHMCTRPSRRCMYTPQDRLVVAHSSRSELGTAAAEEELGTAAAEEELGTAAAEEELGTAAAEEELGTAGKELARSSLSSAAAEPYRGLCTYMVVPPYTARCARPPPQPAAAAARQWRPSAADDDRMPRWPQTA